MRFLQAGFWLGSAIVVYAYAGYGAVIALLARTRPRRPRAGDVTPRMTLVIPCFNEAGYIAAKLENSLDLDYPADRLEILVVDDGSDDGTRAVAEAYADRGVRCIVQPVRSGKEAAMQAAARQATGEVLVFTDANAELNREALRKIARWFADPTVGCVAGEKRMLAGGSGSGESAYWRYESFLKRQDSMVGSTMGATGELVAVRSSLMSYENTDDIIEDFMLSMRVVQSGHRVVYEPEAFATEPVSARIEDLFERRARIAAGGFQALWRLRSLFDPRRGIVWWQFVSHRALRWALVPFLLPALVALNALLARASRFYRATLAVQAVFYLAAAIGWRTRHRPIGRFPLFYFPFFFCTVNAAAIVGCVRLLAGRQSVLWKRTRP